MRRNLQKTVRDRDLLRYMTGDWFYETKQLRHQERIHSCDIIRASMKQAQKPPTTRESLAALPLGQNEVQGCRPFSRGTCWEQHRCWDFGLSVYILAVLLLWLLDPPPPAVVCCSGAPDVL